MIFAIFAGAHILRKHDNYFSLHDLAIIELSKLSDFLFINYRLILQKQVICFSNRHVNHDIRFVLIRKK